MSTLKLGAPRVISEGIRDQSGRLVIQENLVEPTHVPIIFLLAAKQHKEPLFMYPSQISQLLGSETVERGSKYYSHQSQLLEIIAHNANPFLFYPVQVPEAKKAFLRLSVAVTDLRAAEIAPPMAIQNVVDVGEDLPGKRYHLAWMNGTQQYPSELAEFGEAEPFELAPGTMVYPILEAELEYAGEYGNNYGLQIKQITSAQSPQGISKTTAMTYTASVIERAKSSSPRIVKTIFGEDTFSFSLDEDVVDRLGRPLYLPLVFENQFNLTQGSMVQNFGEFEVFKVYTENLEEVQALLFEQERHCDSLIPAELYTKWALHDNPANASLLNIFTGKMFDGVTNYHTFSVDKALLIGSGNVAFAHNGDSGIPDEKSSKARFNNANALVDGYVFDLEGVVNSEHSDLHNHDRWDYSIVYDTGFAPDAKNTLIALLGARKDVCLFLTPMSYGTIEVLPDIETVIHEGYMRSANNFQPIAFNRSEKNIEVKGLATNLLVDRELLEFKILVDGISVPYSNLNFDNKGYWSATVAATHFGQGTYAGTVAFHASVGVKEHPEYPVQEVISTAMEYTVVPASLPVPEVTQVWGGVSVPYSKTNPEYQGTLGALAATVTSSDGNLTELFEVLSAKFTYGASKEMDISRNFVIWDSVYATPTRADLLNGMAKKATAKLVIRVRDRISQETRTIESAPYEYEIKFPNLNPVLTVTQVNGGNPIVPAYADVTAPTVKVLGEVTGLGVDALLTLERMVVKVNGVTVTNAQVDYTLSATGESATFEATVQRGYFPILAANDQNINISAPGTGVIGESYHALADVEVVANYKQKHLNDAGLPVSDAQDVYVSDMIGMRMNWDGVVDYNDPIANLVDPNDGIILVASLPEVNGIENVGVELNGSYIDYQQIVSAKATLHGKSYDLKVLNNYTLGAGRIVRENFWPSYIKAGNIAFEFVVKHRSGHNVKLAADQAYSVKYPALPALTTKTLSVNGDNTIWFDEAWANPDKTVRVTGELTGLHTLRKQKNIQLAVDTIIREDVVVNVNRAAGTWTADVPVRYMNLEKNTQVALNLVVTYLPDNADVVAVATAKPYTVKTLKVPNFLVDSVNAGLVVDWTASQGSTHKTDIVIGGYVDNQAVSIDPAFFTMSTSALTINDASIPNSQVTWSRKTVDGVEKLVATVPTSTLIFRDRPFAATGALVAKITLNSNHNSRPYEIMTPVAAYEIAPKLGVVAIQMTSYNDNSPIDALNNATATYALRGTVSGLAPYQSITNMQFQFQGTQVNPATFSLGVAEADEGGFLTYPFTATFLGSAHLGNVLRADLSAYPDHQASGGTLPTPSGAQGTLDFTVIPNSGWTEVNGGEVDPLGYKGSISATALITNSVTAVYTTVSTFESLGYDLIPLRSMSASLGQLTTSLLDPGTEVIANQVRKYIDFNIGLVRQGYDSLVGIEVSIGTRVIPTADVLFHKRIKTINRGYGKYDEFSGGLSIPNSYIVEGGEYLEMTVPYYKEGLEAVGLYKAPVKVKFTLRDKLGNDRIYTAESSLFSRTYYAVKAVAEVVSINNGQQINRWDDPNTLIPIQVRVKELYKRAMGHDVSNYNFTVDGRTVPGIQITDAQFTEAPYYNSTSTLTAAAQVKLSDMVELMSVWDDSNRSEPYLGALGIAPRIHAENGQIADITRATKQFTAVEILPASQSTMDIEPVNGGATVILNSTSTYPIEVKAVVHQIRPIWGEHVNPERVSFGINGQTVPRGDYTITVNNGMVDNQGNVDATISIKTTREVYKRYFADAYMEIDEVALEAGIPVQGGVRVNAPVDSTYGLRITLTQDVTFLAGMAVEGPEDDVTVGSVVNHQLYTQEDGFRIVDLTTNEILAEGANYEELVEDAIRRGGVSVEVVGYYFPQ